MDVNVQKINGSWDNGFSLDKHSLKSVYTGENASGRKMFDTTRTEAGESLYQLKSNNDYNQVPMIARELSLEAASQFSFVSFIIPMPSSKQRARQPVTEISRQVAVNMGIQCIENMLLKKTQTEQVKNISGKDKRMEALSNKLYLEDVLEDNMYNVMIVDDLFDTGATLETATNILRGYSKISQIFVATVTKTKQ